MTLQEFINKYIKVFNKVTVAPTTSSADGIYFVSGTEKGLYIVSTHTGVKSVHKIFDTSDYYTKAENNASSYSLQSQIDGLGAMSTVAEFTTYAAMVAAVNPVSDITGDPLGQGQLVLVKGDTDISKNGIYRFKGLTAENVGLYSFVTALGDLSVYAVKGDTTKTLAEVSADAKSINEIDYWGDVTEQGYLNGIGNPEGDSDPNWQRSPYFKQIPLGAAYIDIRAYGHPSVNTVSFFNKYKSYVAGDRVEELGTFEKKVPIPENAVFFKLSGGSQSYGLAASSKPFRAVITIPLIERVNSLQQDIVSLSPPKVGNRKQFKVMVTPSFKIMLAGDSISSQDYPWYKDSMESLTGAEVYNGGFSGYTAAQLASNTCIQRIFDYNPNVIVLLIGGNDPGQAGTVGTFTGLNNEPVVPETDINANYSGTYYIQAVSHMIRKLKANYYNIRARANLTGSETEAEKTAKIDSVLKPHILFCTGIPQQRNSSGDQFSLKENWMRKRDAVTECCEKYNVHCVDLLGILDWDMSLEPFWTNPTDTVTNKGIYTMDGLHPNKYGYQQISSIICGEIGII
jgi:lysophospholipase L1-like esterase